MRGSSRAKNLGRSASGLLASGVRHVCLVNNHLEPAHDAAVRAVGGDDQRQRDERREQRKRDDPAHGMAHAPGQAPAGAPGQRAQYGRDLPGGLSRARGLDRERLLEIGDHARGVGVAQRQILGGRAIDDRGGRGGDLGPG